MRILAVETSSLVASCCVCEDERLISEEIVNTKLTHSETLMPMIDSVLKKAELEIKDIDVFAVAVGPGSFTGLRIGISAVKALAHAFGKKVCGVSTLKALSKNIPFCDKLIVPIMDARRQEVYTAIYDGDNEILEPSAMPVSSLLDILKEKGRDTVFLGDGVPVFRDTIKEALGDMAHFAPVNLNLQRASSVAYLAATQEKSDYSGLSPVYLRKSQAEREREEREAK